jgi:diacylglycerol kinase family enzyme
VRSWQISVCNGKSYGTGLKICKNANLTQNRLHAVSSEMRHWWQGFSLIPQLLLGRYRDPRKLSYFSGHRIRIETIPSLGVDIDRDLKTQTPVEIPVHRGALRIFAPRGTAVAP